MNIQYFSAEKKKEFEYHLARILLEAIYSNIIEYEDAREIARYILLNIDSIKADEEYLKFIEELCKKSVVFKSLANMESQKVQYTTAEQQKINAIKAQLSKLSQ